MDHPNEFTAKIDEKGFVFLDLNRMSYFVIAYNEFCPAGGFNDCKEVCDSLETAIAKAKPLLQHYDDLDFRYGYDLVEIWTMEGNKPVMVKKWELGREGFL